MQQLLHSLTYCMIALIFLAFLLGISRRRQLPVALKYLVALLLVAFVAEVCGQLSMHYRRESTIIFNVYIMVEFIILMAMAIRWVQKKRFTNIIVAAITIYTVSWCIYILCCGYDMFITRIFLLGCIFLCCSYLYIIFFIARITDNPTHHPFFWVALGIVIYFGGCIPLFSMFDYLKSHEKIRLGSYLYTINDILAIIRYLLILYGLSLPKREKTPE